MERHIQEAIKAFAADLDPRKLDILDRMLFFALLKKESLEINGDEPDELRKLRRLCKEYAQYRDRIYKGLAKGGVWPEDRLRSSIYPAPARLILLLTHNCQLRCAYCRVRKFPGSMTKRVLQQAVRLLFTSEREDLQLQFFGGEPLLRFDLIQAAVAYARKINEKMKRRLRFILTTNGIALTSDKIKYFKKNNFLIECSLDGPLARQLAQRKSAAGKNYFKTLMGNYKRVVDSGVDNYAISVVVPEDIERSFENSEYLARAGFESIQINYALGVFWTKAATEKLFSSIRKIARAFRSRNIEFINATPNRREPVVLNAEITADVDGGLYSEYGICLEEDFGEMKTRFTLGPVSRVRDINPLFSTPFENFLRLSKAYHGRDRHFKRIILNNIFLGIMMEDFLKGLQQ